LPRKDALRRPVENSFAALYGTCLNGIVTFAKPHPVFVPPQNLDALIWRYTDLAKLLSLLDRSQLFFPRLDKLDDPFEGYYTKTVLALEHLSFEDLPEELKLQIPDEKALSIVIGNQKQMRELAKNQREITFVNSWYCNQHESAAMWSQYLKTQEGIAIRSSYQRLTESFERYQDFEVHIGMVNYLDYESDTIPFGNILAPVMFKRKSFEHERELRAVVWTLEHGKNAMGSENKFKDISGLYVAIDIPTLIERIYVTPTAPTWVRELIGSLVKRFGYTIPVVQSSLADAAFY
jgi:hypothetical protein